MGWVPVVGSIDSCCSARGGPLTEVALEQCEVAIGVRSAPLLGIPLVQGPPAGPVHQLPVVDGIDHRLVLAVFHRLCSLRHAPEGELQHVRLRRYRADRYLTGLPIAHQVLRAPCLGAPVAVPSVECGAGGPAERVGQVAGQHRAPDHVHGRMKRVVSPTGLKVDVANIGAAALHEQPRPNARLFHSLVEMAGQRGVTPQVGSHVVVELFPAFLDQLAEGARLHVRLPRAPGSAPSGWCRAGRAPAWPAPDRGRP